jgi:hypothetical protein
VRGIDMKRIRSLVPVVVLVFTLLPVSAFATTPTPYHEAVFGVETGPPQSTATCGAPSSVSSFAGIARGTLNGVFLIAVCHTPLSPSATILGGTFVLRNRTTTVTGAFADGAVSFVSMSVIDSLCIQKFTVSGDLLPSGQFAGTLLHYGHLTGSSCNVLFATISGSALLTA